MDIPVSALPEERQSGGGNPKDYANLRLRHLPAFQHKFIDQSRLEVIQLGFGVVETDDVNRQLISFHFNPQNVFIALYSRCAARFVVVPVKKQRDRQIPAEPDAAHPVAQITREQKQYHKRKRVGRNK
jgi:hypothetical protein